MATSMLSSYNVDSITSLCLCLGLYVVFILSECNFELGGAHSTIIFFKLDVGVLDDSNRFDLNLKEWNHQEKPNRFASRAANRPPDNLEL